MKKGNAETSAEVGYDITAVLLGIQAFWHVTLRHWTSGSRHSERTTVPAAFLDSLTLKMKVLQSLQW